MPLAPTPTLPTTEIFLRSPYWVTVTETNLDFVLCELRIWTGELSAEPTYADIKLRSTGLNNTTSMDLAEFARDFVEVIFNTGAESDAVFISYELEIYSNGNETPTTQSRVYLTGLDGYGTFQDGVNFQWYKQVMLSDTEVTAYPETSISLPVLQKTLTGYSLQHYVGNPLQLHTFHTVTGITQVQNTSNLIRYVVSSYGAVYADRVLFHFSDKADEVVNINYTNCSPYGYTRVYFVNRLGCTQQLHFFGKFEVSMTAKDEDFNRNILVNGDYNSTRHQQSILNKNGKINITLNSGWRTEEENDTIIEMMMSEQVWMVVDSTKLGNGWTPKKSSSWTIPVNVTSDKETIKSRLNDKMINYSFKFEAAHDWINSVR